MATARTREDLRVASQAAVLKAWGQAWRRERGAGQQDLGRAAGYGSDASPKSAAVAISRIESGKTEPTGRYRLALLEVLGRTEDDLRRATDDEITTRSRPGALGRVMAGPVSAENDVRRAQILAGSNALTQRVAFQSQIAGQVFERVGEHFVLPFLERASAIDWRPLDAAGGARDGGTAVSSHIDIPQLRARTRADLLATMIGGGARGVGATATAAGMLAAVSASASTSTSAAIAAIPGVTPSSATLAWLGGGSLTATGMGLAGGTAVLAGVVALPALLALGAVLMWKGRQLRREAEAEADKLDAAEHALEDMAAAVAGAERWNEAQQDVIERAGLIGRTIDARLVSPVMARLDHGREGRIPWGEIPAAARQALEMELDLVSMILDARALPIWLGVSSVGRPDLDDDERRTAARSQEWIDASLARARRDLDADEQWLRRSVAQGPADVG